jgi:hypothetical protein
VKAAGGQKPKNAASAQAVEAEPEKEGQMSEKQAQLLLQSMKDEEQRVQRWAPRRPACLSDW